MSFQQDLSVMLLPQGENLGVRPKNKNRLRMFPAERDEEGGGGVQIMFSFP